MVLELDFAVIYNVLWSWNQILLLFTMFRDHGIRFCCYLQRFVILESDFAVIYNVLCTWNKILLLCTAFCAMDVCGNSAFDFCGNSASDMFCGP